MIGCWCDGSNSWTSFGTAEHLPDGTCPIREHWLSVEDSEFATDSDVRARGEL